MSSRTAYVITCDVPGCDAEYVTSHADQTTARLDAGGNHWRQRAVKGRRSKWLDICPDHRQDGDV